MKDMEMNPTTKTNIRKIIEQYYGEKSIVVSNTLAILENCDFLEFPKDTNYLIFTPTDVSFTKSRIAMKNFVNEHKETVLVMKIWQLCYTFTYKTIYENEKDIAEIVKNFGYTKPNPRQYKYHPKNVDELREAIFEEMKIQGKESLKLGCIDTSAVRSFENLMAGKVFTPIKHLDLSGWNTKNVLTMKKAFAGCKNLESINMQGWIVLGSTESMFEGCVKLREIGDLSDWHIRGRVDDMFKGCNELKQKIRLNLVVDEVSIPKTLSNLDLEINLVRAK